MASNLRLRTLDSDAVSPTFKPVYLIHGDDHGRIAERRARLRELAESISGAEGVELLEGDDASPERAAAALDAMTLAVSRRFIIVDGAERFKDKELEPLLTSLAAVPAETTIAFFAREDSRSRAPERLHEAVRKAGGDIDAENSVKPWELPKWATARARELGLELEPEGAKALVGHVGERQQRLLRELEKLALGADEGAVTLDAAAIEELTASSAERRAWAVADALVAGDARTAVAAYLRLREQGERLPGLLYWISQRVRAAHDVAVALDAGEPPAQIKRRLRMPSRAADRLIADARRAGSERLAAAISEIADLELASRGGGPGGAGEDTAALIALGRLAA
jgi:DNA polymerase III subunit delta